MWMKGGAIAMHSLNSSFTDFQATFSRYYKNNEGSQEWYSNITATVQSKKVFGQAIFFAESSQPAR